MKIKHSSVFLMLLILSIAGCATTTQRALDSEQSQVEVRSIQTRAFDSTDKKKMLRTIMSTLQDLDFVIERADADLGTVTGAKFVKNTVLKMTVTVRPRGETQLLVRANAQYGLKAIDKPEPYQDFFNALAKSLFLTAQQVD